MPGIGIITNPHSKSNKRNPDRSKLLSYLVGEAGFLETTNNISDLEKVAQNFADKDIEYLAINGGDGTISHTISVFIRCYAGKKPLPKILLLRGGTMNVIASNLGLSGTPEHILSRIVEAVSTGEKVKIKRLSTIEVDGQIGFLYADGTSAHMLEEFYKKKAGMLRGAYLGLRLTLSCLIRGSFHRRMIQKRAIAFHPDPHPVVKHDTIGTYASTLARLPLGLPMFGRSIKSGAFFRAISVSMEPYKLVFRFLPMSLYSKPGQFLGKYNFDAKKLRIVGEKAFRYTLDGELFTSVNNQVTIKTGRTLEFVIF